MTPTPEQVKKWAHTPIAISMSTIIDPDGNVTTKHHWERHTQPDGTIIEYLEGLPTTKWILEKISKGKNRRSYQLVGVERIS